MTLAAGTRFGPYEILAPLGAGGMGEVYRAKDTKLGRDVAIKVLPESVSADPERLARFEREARALASLNHPNIVTVYSVEEAGDMRLLAMELVEGQTLDLAITAGGLPLSRFFEIAVPLADALSAAHERGIVHRDLKPANVMLTREGRLKVLDFGLAKLVAVDPDPDGTGMATASRAELTGEGTVFGTVAYMSPEQARGGKIDARSDVFSLGVVLYEMLTGDRPFKGASSVDIISSILRDWPSPVTELRADLPPHVGRILRRCLAKDVHDRYQTSRDVFNELRDLQAETSAPSVASRAPSATPARGASGQVRADEGLQVAVLPFKSSGDAEMESFAAGLGEEIATGLSRFRYLSVVSSDSADRLKGEAGDERALGARLGARYVLEGSIRRGGSAVRVSAQLVDARTGARLWAETYNRDLQASSTFAAQDDIAARIVATVADSYGVLVHSMRSATRQKDDADLTPVEWQFQYFAYREQITPSAYAELKSRLERAVKRDDRQSDLWACLAQIFVDEYAFGFGTDPAALDRALAAARRAVELDRANQFALVALAQTHFFRQDLAAFGPAAERAMALNPLNTDAVGILGLQIVHTGEFERGAEIVRRAMELNANHAGWMHFAPLWEHFHREEYEQALERANRVDVPGLFWPYLVVASACGHLGRRAEAEAAVRDLLALDPEFAAHARSNVGTWHFASGLMDPILEGLRKAGLSIPATVGSSDSPGRSGTVTATAGRAESGTESGQARADEAFRVTVLPFKYGGADASFTALCEGLTEEIVTGLSRFSYLRVISRSATAGAGSAGKELGARYVMEGSLRQSGPRLRIAVQLVDASSGANLWAETFDRPFQPEAVFELQDEIVPRIVSTVADMNGVLPRSMSEAVRGRDPEQLSPYEAVLRSFGYLQRVSPEELAVARAGLELAVRKAPDYADAWAMLAFLSVQEYGQGFKLQADPLTSGTIAARRAVEAAPSNPLAYFSLAQALFFQKDFQSFRNAAERAVALNPMDGNSTAFLGELLTYASDEERGLALAGRAKQLNPNHPGWYWYADFYNAYRHGDYRGALGFVVNANLPGHWGMHAAMAASYGQLGERDAAAKALRVLLKLRPAFAAEARAEFEKWWEPAYVESFLDGLRKAGLEIAGEKMKTLPEPDAARSSTGASGAVRADEGFWVAVLPFKYTGANAGLTALAEGLTEDIVTGLSRFSYLRVISRSSTSRYASESVDVRSAGRELGARYVMEGSLRQAGTKLRLAVQLVDAVSGAHLWAENYERAFSAETVFELQDDLVPRIVSTVADAHGVLPHIMSEGLRRKSSEELSPYEAVLRSFGYGYRITPEEHAVVLAGLERAVEATPGYSDAWAMLSLVYGEEHSQGFNPRPDSLGRALHAAQRAADAAPSNALAFNALARAYFFRKEFPAFRAAAERAIELNPLNGPTLAGLGSMMAYAGDWEHGCALVERATQLNPRHPGWYWMALFMNAYRKGDYRGAIRIGLKINLPEFSGTHEAMAAAYGQLGERDAAGRAVRELLRLKPDYLARPREKLQKFVSPELVEHMMDGLRKAGLDVPAQAGADPASAPPDSVAIAVLPFSDLSPAKDQDYLCEGMAEEIMNALVRIDGIRVASRTSAFRAQQCGGDLAAIARALSVGHVLEGSVRTSGTRLRVTAQLTDVASGYQLWSERFDRDAADVFAVQDEIAAGVVDAVKVWLAPGSRTVQPRRQVHNLEAYRLYLKGRHLRYTKNDHGGALSCFEQATALDPSHGPSWVGLADVSILASAIGLKPSREAYGAAKAALQTAAGLQGESGEALYVEGMIAFGERRWKDCERLMARATQVEPGHVQARCWTASLLCLQGRTEEAVQAFDRAREMDPLAPYPYAMTGLCLLQEGRLEEAGAFLDQALAFDGDNILALWVSGAALTARRLFDPAIARLERAVALSNRSAFIHGTLGWALAEAGRAKDANAVLAALRGRPAPAPTALPEAWMLAALGDREGAWQVLDRACDEKQLLVSFTGLPGFDRLRTDPRFGALRVRMGLPPAQPVPQTGLEAPASPRADSATGRDAAVAIAVLPFSDLSPAKDQEYLCEGMAEEIMNALVPIDGIRVASRTSAFRARQGGGDLASIARALSVNHVLEGSVRTAGARLRVTAQLTDVASGYQLWSERFDRDAADIFAVQDEIAAGVVEAVKARLAPGSRTVQHRAKVHNLEAYRSYLKGRHLRGMEDYGGALRAFEEAVRLDPAHAPSWTGLAEITVLAAHMGMIPPRAACTAARKALATAKELQGESADGLHVEAFAAFLERRWNAMETAWRRALELQPDHVLALGSFAISLCARGRLDEALPLFARAREADPLASFPYMLAGWGLLVSGKPEEGLRYIEDALTFEKEDASAIAASCMVNVALGRLEEAIPAGEHGVAVSHRAPFFLGVLGWALATAGRKDEARKILEELRARPAGSPTAVSEAWLLGALGEIDAAFDVLARAEEEHQGLLSYTGLPGFDPLRADPRFGALLGRLGLPSSLTS